MHGGESTKRVMYYGGIFAQSGGEDWSHEGSRFEGRDGRLVFELKRGCFLAADVCAKNNPCHALCG